MRAPKAEYEPAPPTMSLTGGFGGGNSISSNNHLSEILATGRATLPMMNMPRVQKSIPPFSSAIIVNDLEVRCLE